MSLVYHPAVAAFMLSNNATCRDEYGGEFELVENDGKPHALQSAKGRKLNVRVRMVIGRSGLTTAERIAAEACVGASAAGKPVEE